MITYSDVQLNEQRKKINLYLYLPIFKFVILIFIGIIYLFLCHQIVAEIFPTLSQNLNQ